MRIDRVRIEKAALSNKYIHDLNWAEYFVINFLWQREENRERYCEAYIGYVADSEDARNFQRKGAREALGFIYDERNKRWLDAVIEILEERE